jgi:hypothetical protein
MLLGLAINANEGDLATVRKVADQVETLAADIGLDEPTRDAIADFLADVRRGNHPSARAVAELFRASLAGIKGNRPYVHAGVASGIWTGIALVAANQQQTMSAEFLALGKVLGALVAESDTALEDVGVGMVAASAALEQERWGVAGKKLNGIYVAAKGA